MGACCLPRAKLTKVLNIHNTGQKRVFCYIKKEKSNFMQKEGQQCHSSACAFHTLINLWNVKMGLFSTNVITHSMCIQLSFIRSWLLRNLLTTLKVRRIGCCVYVHVGRQCIWLSFSLKCYLTPYFHHSSIFLLSHVSLSSFSDPPLCTKCGQPAIELVTKKEGPNKGTQRVGEKEGEEKGTSKYY